MKLTNPGKCNALRAVAALEQREDVYSAGPNYVVQPMAVVLPDMPSTDYAWGANKIQLDDAWEIETGSSGVLVGVVDSGIDNTHPDLANRVNTALSANFTGDSDSVTYDYSGHGTHVAGIIAAKDADSNFVRGVCQNVTLVSLRVFSQKVITYATTLASAINYAETNNIPLLNLSLDSGNAGIDDLHTAINNYSGLLVCAIGNSGADADISGSAQPATFDNNNIISVGASTESDAKRTTSNYGMTTLDLFAPGENIVSCYPRDLCALSNCPSTAHVSYGYHYMSGTSMATPFVTGVAALILAHNSLVTPEWIKEIIIESVDTPSAFNNICVSDGRLNALSALSHPGAHDNTTCSYVNTLQHRCTCPECGVNWLEDHMIHPVLGTCMLCNHNSM